jgi:putative oxidoreductase
MNYLQRLEKWGDSHHPKWLDIIRIALGIFLCYKGFEFLHNMSAMMTLMDNQVPFGSFMLIIIGHYIVFAHLVGGFLLALGMLTRFACLIQIPVLIGAIIFINASHDIMRPFSELLLSIVVLMLLIFFLIVGNGPWSFDWFVEHDKRVKNAH